MIIGICVAIVGLVAIVFHRALAGLSVEYQNDLFKNAFKHKLGGGAEKFGEVMFVLVGAALLAVGLLATFGIIRFQ